MYVIGIAILLSSLSLLILGSMSVPMASGLITTALGLIGYKIYLDLNDALALKALKKTHKSKFACLAKHLYDLPLAQNQSCSVQITRQDQLMLLAIEYDKKFSIKELEGLALMDRQAVLALSDELLCARLGLAPLNLSYFRRILKGRTRITGKPLLLLNLGGQSDSLVVIELKLSQKAFKALKARPEIKVKEATQLRSKDERNPFS